MSIQSEFRDYVLTNTSLTDLKYMEDDPASQTPRHVLQDVTKGIIREHLSTDERIITMQVRSTYNSSNYASDISLDEEFENLFKCSNDGNNFKLPSYIVYELDYSNVVNIQDPYYTFVKQFDFKYKEI